MIQDTASSFMYAEGQITAQNERTSQLSQLYLPAQDEYPGGQEQMIQNDWEEGWAPYNPSR